MHHSQITSTVGMHVQQCGQPVRFDPDDDDITVQAIVRLDDPTVNYDRGEGNAHRGRLMVEESRDPGLARGSKLLIGGKVYMVERVERASGGSVVAWIYGNNQDYTAHNTAVNRDR